MKKAHLLCAVALVLGWISVFHATRIHHNIEIPTDAIDGATTGMATAPPTTRRTTPHTTPTTREQHRPSREDTISPADGCRELAVHANATTVSSVRLCFSAADCKGSLEVRLKDCERRRRPLSHNKSLDAALQALGPDLIRVRLDGPETVAIHATYEGLCRYSAALGPFTAVGTYVVAAEMLYDHYNAQDEVTKQWPPLLKQSLLPTDPAFTTKYHLQQMTLPSIYTVSCSSAPSFEEPTNACTGLEGTDGRWVREEPSSLVHTRVRVKKIQKSPIIFQWAIASEPASVWRPNQCHAPAVETEKIRKRIVIGGDSQLRALYFGLVNHLSGNGDVCVRNITTQSSEPSKCIANVKGSQRKTIGGAQVDFVDDLFLDKFHSSERYAAYDVVVVGFAQHPASKEHWSVDKYRRALAGRHRKAVDLAKQGKTVVWYLAPQYPHTRVGYPVFVRDWRTDRRLQLFNAEAEALMRQSKIPVLDGFAISTGMSHSSPDQAHFSNFVSTEFVKMLLSIISSQ